MWEMQKVLSKIWTRVTVSIAYKNIDYFSSASNLHGNIEGKVLDRSYGGNNLLFLTCQDHFRPAFVHF